MEQAAHVVDAIAEVANSLKTAPPVLPRSASFLAMPPPKTRVPPHQDPHEELSSQGLELLSKAAAALPIVSPDMSGHTSPHHIPDLRLELSCLTNQRKEDEDVSQMSADQCASIVDNIFGEGVDDSVFHHQMEPPAAKRARAC